MVNVVIPPGLTDPSETDAKMPQVFLVVMVVVRTEEMVVYSSSVQMKLNYFNSIKIKYNKVCYRFEDGEGEGGLLASLA